MSSLSSRPTLPPRPARAGGAAGLGRPPRRLRRRGRSGDSPPPRAAARGPWTLHRRPQAKVDAPDPRPTRWSPSPGWPPRCRLRPRLAVVGVFGPTTLTDGTPDAAGRRPRRRQGHRARQRLGRVQHREVRRAAPRAADHPHVRARTPSGTSPTRAKDKILKLAPSVGIAISGLPMTTPDPALRRAGRLPRRGPVRPRRSPTQKARFEAAAELRAAVKANPGIKVMACSAAPTLLRLQPRRSAPT